MKSWVTYKNGNYIVKIHLGTGTKIRQNNLDYFDPDTIESCDVKITNYCSGAGNRINISTKNILPDFKEDKVNSYGGCPFCHEGSSPLGKHGDILSPSWLDKLHPYCEIAIGGGNPLAHPDLEKFLIKCKERKHIPNMTVNQTHFEKEFDRVYKLTQEKLIFGLGISLVKVTPEFINLVKKIPTAVIHVINGIVSEEELKLLANNNLKILILGYKEVRRGKKLYEKIPEYINEKKESLKNLLPTIIKENWFDVVSFDNLALKQLDVKSLMSEEQWNKFYQGDDGLDGEQTSATFFVDMVERKFARNSCASEEQRYPIMETAEEMFNFLKRK